MNRPLGAKPSPITSPSRWRKWLLTLLFAAIALLAGMGWLLATSSGLQWLAAMASRSSGATLDLQDASGTLLGPLGARSLSYRKGDLRISVTGLQLDWHPAALLAGRLDIATLAAQDVEVLAPPSSEPSAVPNDLRLPLPLSIGRMELGSLSITRQAGAAPDFAATRLSARLESDGRQHRLHELRASLEYGELSASARIDSVRPFALQARAELAGRGTRPARITASASGALENIALQAQGDGAGLSGQGEALLRPFIAFPLAALKLSLSGFDPSAFSPAAPQASLALQANLQPNAAGSLEGEVSAKNASPAPLDRGGLPLLEASARATISGESARLDALKLDLSGGGRVSGDLSWQWKPAAGEADLAISQLDPAALDTRLRPARLDGKATLSGDSLVQQGVIALAGGKLRLDARLKYSGATLALDSLRLSHGQAALTGQGHLASGGGRPYAFKGELAHFDLSAFLQAPRSDLNARLEIAGELAPQANGKLQFTLGNSQLAGQPVSGGGELGFEGMKHFSGAASLRLGDNHLSAWGAYGAPGEQLELTLAAPALAQLGSGFGGALNAHATLGGSPEKPEITFAMKGDHLALLGAHHLASLDAGGSLQGEAVNFKGEASGYRGNAEVLMQNLTLAIEGRRSRHEVSARAHLGTGAVVDLEASGGLVAAPGGGRKLQWQGVLAKLAGSGQIAFHLRAPAPLLLGRERVSLGAAEFAVAGGQARLASAEWSPSGWSSRGNFAHVGLHTGGSVRDAGNTLRLAGDWDVSASPNLAGSLSIRHESGDWALPGDPPLALGVQNLQLDARASDNRLSVELTARGTRLGDWRASMALPLARGAVAWSMPTETPLSGKIQIDVADLSWLGPALGSNFKSSGHLSLAADVAGTLGKPLLSGQLSGGDLAVAMLDQGIRLEQGRLAARLEQSRLHVDQLSFVAPHEAPPRDRLLAGLRLAKEPGGITLAGVIDPLGKRGNLELRASRLPLARTTERWILVSGQGDISYEHDTLGLGGKITADAGLISQPAPGRPQLSADVVIIGRQAAATKGLRITVDAILDLGEQLYLRASGLEARLAGQVRLRGTPAQPLRATGTIATRDASFQAYGQKLTVERGIVNFQGALDNPGLNILALRNNLPVEAGVAVTGTVRRPLVHLVSTPNLPDPEKLSWIVLGRAPDAGGSDASLLLAAAGSILGGQSGGITGQLAQALGVDELSLGQAQNGDPLASQIVTVGKRLSTRAFLSYEQGLTAVAGTTKLTYTLTPSISIVTRAGLDNAIDVLYTFHFD